MNREETCEIEQADACSGVVGKPFFQDKENLFGIGKERRFSFILMTR